MSHTYWKRGPFEFSRVGSIWIISIGDLHLAGIRWHIRISFGSVENAL